MSVPNNGIAEDCGHFFEIGFNVGILTAIRQQKEKVKHHLGTLYQEDLSELHFLEMTKKSFQRNKFPGAEQKRKIVRQWFLFFLQKGFLAGLNFFQEYIASLNWQKEADELEIAYYQCSFCGDNSIYTNTKPEETEWQAILLQLAHLGVETTTIQTQRYCQTGRFLKADALMLFRYGTQWRILCIDLSIFSIASPEHLPDPNDITSIRKLLRRDIGYIRSKSVFTNLSIDTASGSPGFRFSKGLETYFTAFKHEDKEGAKLIQAGSYAYDFYQFLLERLVLTEHSQVTFNIIGYTDRNINAMAFNQQNVHILQTCAKIYRYDTGEKNNINNARYAVLDLIRANTAYGFEDGEAFTESIVEVANNPDGIFWISPSHRETITDFSNPHDALKGEQVNEDVRTRLRWREGEVLSLMDAHARLVTQELDAANKKTLLFLTGNPGIGKTTAIVKFLQAHQDEGFLFIYVSPRQQVNRDIIEKFREKPEGSLSGNVFAIIANSIFIQDNQGKLTVHYHAAHQQGNFARQGTKKPVSFIDAQRFSPEQPVVRRQRLEQLSEQRIWDKGEESSGVLNSICEALYISLRDDISRQIVATVATQSLKKTGENKDTLDHLKKIFHTAFNSKTARVIPEKMDEIAGRIKHIFFMLDEITGDEGGVAFLEGINDFVRRYELTKHHFNTKIIVADASVVDQQIIERHLQESTYEPDKIYFKHISPKELPGPLSYTPFDFDNKPAVAINANAYPARQLHITYNVCTEFLKYNEETILELKDRLTDTVQKKIMLDLLALLRREDVPQIIVYIQDKQRLMRLIHEIKACYEPFLKNEHYIEIHANISENEKNDIDHFKDRVRVVFMTASASRGLSFLQTTAILVDIPHFEIEQNLMEIIQVIYRGRGDKEIDQREKQLLFYLSDRAFYGDDERRALSLRESTLNLLNVLLILKTSIMTRIRGYGNVGTQKLMMIPIGGKSVLAAGETYIGEMEKLINDLRKEHIRHPEQPWLRDVYRGLHEIFSQGDFRLSTPRGKNQKAQEALSYFSLLSTFSLRFEDAVYNGFHHLLDWKAFEQAYISGNLLIVSSASKKLQENYLMQIAEKLKKTRGEELWRKMQGICSDANYHPVLRAGMRKALELINLLNDSSPDKTQHLLQDSQHADQYYALPLLVPMLYSIIKEHFLNEKAEAEDETFRSLLANYARSLYSITTVLPIGSQYAEFPFLFFRSFTFKEIRNKMFSDTHMFISNEMNVLNMILSYKDH